MKKVRIFWRIITNQKACRNIRDNKASRPVPWKFPCSTAWDRRNKQSAPGGTFWTWPWCNVRRWACRTRRTVILWGRGSVSRSKACPRAQRSCRRWTGFGTSHRQNSLKTIKKNSIKLSNDYFKIIIQSNLCRATPNFLPLLTGCCFSEVTLRYKTWNINLGLQNGGHYRQVVVIRIWLLNQVWLYASHLLFFVTYVFSHF